MKGIKISADDEEAVQQQAPQQPTTQSKAPVQQVAVSPPVQKAESPKKIEKPKEENLIDF